MNKKRIIYILIFSIFILFAMATKVAAKDTDRILNYVVTVEPRMNDGTLDIIYEITWKVLDSDSEGPLRWLQIGTPNSYFDEPKALTNNIKTISKYNGSYVKIVFNQLYYEGDELTFKYRIHQPYMYKLSFGNCKYSFTPAWFTNAKIDNLTIKWNKDKVKSSNNQKTEGNYLIWNKKNLANGGKLTVNVKYSENAFRIFK